MKIIKTFIIFFFVILPINISKSEIIVMSKCDDKQDEFLKNEYILNLNVVGRKGLEPSQIALSVPKTDASTNSAIAPQFQGFIYY